MILNYENNMLKNFLFLLFCMIQLSCSFSDEIDTEIFVFPKDYKGVVLIFYNIPGGEKDSIIGNKIIYNIPSSGIKFMEKGSQPVNMLNTDYYYQNAPTIELCKYRNRGSCKSNIEVYSDNVARNGDYVYNYLILSDANSNKYDKLIITAYVDSLLRNKLIYFPSNAYEVTSYH